MTAESRFLTPEGAVLAAEGLLSALLQNTLHLALYPSAASLDGVVVGDLVVFIDVGQRPLATSGSVLN